MIEYVIEYQGVRYEFPTWKEMMEFIEDHELNYESESDSD